jgi:hypothetical protein
MIELVSSARRLGREIAPVVGVDRAMQGHPPGDIDAGARESVKLARVVGHQANPGAAKRRRDTSFAIGIASMAVSSSAGFERWAYEIDRSHHDHHGRMDVQRG